MSVFICFYPAFKLCLRVRRLGDFGLFNPGPAVFAPAEGY